MTTKTSCGARGPLTTEMAATRQEAMRTGAPRYVSQRPCPHGHMSFRYTCGGGCGECARLRSRAAAGAKTKPEARKQTLARWNASSKGNEAKLRWKAKNPKNAWACSAVGGAKARAKRDGFPFALTKDYLLSITPDVCPVFGTPFVFYGEGLRPNSPSVDKIVPALGYVPGNVVVISLKANAIKSDATAEEISRVAEWLRTLT